MYIVICQYNSQKHGSCSEHYGVYFEKIDKHVLEIKEMDIFCSKYLSSKIKINLILGSTISAKSENGDLIVEKNGFETCLFKKRTCFYHSPQDFGEYFQKTYKMNDELKGYYLIGAACYSNEVNEDFFEEKFDIYFNNEIQEISRKDLYYLSSKLILEQMREGKDIYLNINFKEYNQIMKHRGQEEYLLCNPKILDYLDSYLLTFAFEKYKERFFLKC